MNRMAAFWCGAIWLLSWIPAFASDGELDPAFAGNGKAIVGFTVNGAATSAGASAIEIQPDGKIILAGFMNSTAVTSAVARLDPDGALDSTFGGDGRADGFFITQAGTVSAAQSVVLQPDGKILVFGVLATYGYVVRLKTDGQLDTSFGDGGKVLYPDSGQGSVSFNAGAVTSAGSILASGTYDDGNGDGPTLLNVLFTANGTLAAAQNVSSVLSIAAGRQGALVLQSDGKALVVVTSGEDCSIVRINIGASLSTDSSFGTGGIATFGWNLGGDNQDFCYAVALQRDGKILMGGGSRSDLSNGFRATVLRLLPNGTLDPGFGKKSFAFASAATGMASTATAILVQNDQSIVLTGIADTADPAHAPQDFAALRLLPDGTLDATFTATTAGSSLGKVVFGFETGSSGRLDEAFAAAMQNNRIVIAGFRTRNDSPIEQFAIARLQNDRLFADGVEP